jgi:hypothetical protein
MAWMTSAMNDSLTNSLMVSMPFRLINRLSEYPTYYETEAPSDQPDN